MSVDHPLWEEHQRKRWMRPDADRWLKPTYEPKAKPAPEPPRNEDYDRELQALQREHLVLKWLFAERRLELARQAFMAKAYNPAQPRVPAGSAGGGQWASDGAAEGGDHKPQLTQLAQDLTGFTKHGINQAITRGVKPSAIHDALTNPLDIRPQRNGTIQFVGSRAVVVVNPSGQVVTIWPTR